MTPRDRTTPRRARTTAAVFAALAAAPLLAGCNTTPLTAPDTRTQFDRYDAARGELQPATLEDEFGRSQPNLRGRLMR